MKDAEVYAAVRFELMRYATALVGVVDAGDLVSAVVARVLAKDGGLAGLEDPKPYLMKSVLNEARMRHRSSVTVNGELELGVFPYSAVSD